MEGQKSPENERKSRAESLIADYLYERNALREGPAFRTPPFVERRVEGTKTVYYAPVESYGTVQREIPQQLQTRRSFVKPETPEARAALPPLPRRVSAKDLIAKLRVIREGVERGPQVVSGEAAKGVETETAPSREESALAVENKEGAETATAPEAVPQKPGRTPIPARDAGGKSAGGTVCPSCGAPLSERNHLLICTGCGKMNCTICGKYELGHMKSDVFYDYKFDFPLCINCYEKAYSIQRMLGKASICYGSGNYSYALYYAKNALALDPSSKYAGKARELIEMIEKSSQEARERDSEWRLARKQLSTRYRAEDPRWR
ncbi:MAG: hypothetical protein QW379_05020 [Thermoplasmata archaeon]